MEARLPREEQCLFFFLSVTEMAGSLVLKENLAKGGLCIPWPVIELAVLS